MFNIGDEVIRKSGRRVIGTVVAVSRSGQRVRVRWHNALRPFSGGYSDNHTTVLTNSIIPATEEARQRMRQQIEERNAKYRAAVEKLRGAA